MGGEEERGLGWWGLEEEEMLRVLGGAGERKRVLGFWDLGF